MYFYVVVALLFSHLVSWPRRSYCSPLECVLCLVPHRVGVLYACDWRTAAVMTGERKHHAGLGEYPVVGRERGADPLPLSGQAVPRLEGGSGQAQGAQGEVPGQAYQVCERKSECSSGDQYIHACGWVVGWDVEDCWKMFVLALQRSWCLLTARVLAAAAGRRKKWNGARFWQKWLS